MTEDDLTRILQPNDSDEVEMNSHSVIQRFGVLLIAAVVAGASQVPRALEGQAVDTVAFAHGLGQSGSNWDPMAADLEARHPLFSLKPDLPDLSPFADQADALRTYLNTQFGGSLDDLAAISHSNGGVTVREYVRTEGSPRLNRHLSLGTPHKGALLAQWLQDGTIGWYAGVVLSDLLNPFIYYIDEDPDWDDLILGGHSSHEAEIEADIIGFDYLDDGLPIAGFVFLTYYVNQSEYADVLPDMWPTSSTFASLNDAQTLTAEAQKLPQARVAISSQFPAHLAPWRPFCIGAANPNYCTVRLWQFWSDLLFFAQEAYEYYASHPDRDLRNNAWRWDHMYWSLLTVPAAWQDWTDTVGDESDGIVSWKSSDYPQGTNNRRVTIAQGLYVHHVEHLDPVPHDDDPFRQEVSAALIEDLDIAYPPPDPDPDPPLEVSIGGPSQVQPEDDMCNWWAVVSGGSGSYQYSWSGVLSGTQSVVSGAVSQSGSLNLTVTSGAQQESRQKFVTVSAGADECFAQQ